MRIPRYRVGLMAAAVLVVCVVTAVSCAGLSSTRPATPGLREPAYRFAAIRPSAPQQEQEAALLAYYQGWKRAFLRQSCQPGTFQIYSPDAAYPYVAEAQGYGMVITASMAPLDPQARSTFDGLLGYVLSHPSSGNADFAAAEQDGTCADRGGANSATDGDMDIAYGLLLADRTWGSSGRYNYRELGIRRIQALKASAVNPASKLMLLGDWSTRADPGLFRTSRTSDWNPQYFRAFESATGDTGWADIRAAHQQAIAGIQSRYSPQTGLLPDFVQVSGGDVQPATGKVLESDHDGDYHFNACRTPWRIGVDAITSGDGASTAAAQKISRWFQATTGGDPDEVRAGYTLAGRPYSTDNDNAFWSPLAVAAMADPDAQGWLDALWAKFAAGSVDPENYFGVSIQLQAMLVIVGRWPAL